MSDVSLSILCTGAFFFLMTRLDILPSPVSVRTCATCTVSGSISKGLAYFCLCSSTISCDLCTVIIGSVSSVCSVVVSVVLHLCPTLFLMVFLVIGFSLGLPSDL